MSNHLKVDGHNNLVRDRRTGAILNTNKNEINVARKLSKINNEKQENINTLTEEVKNLKDDMSQIKDLLFRLVEDKNE